MPKEYAERLARALVENADADPLVVDVPNDGFNDEVAAALEQMGFLVMRNPTKPDRLTIHMKRL